MKRKRNNISYLFIVTLFFISWISIANAQQSELPAQIKRFHALMVKGDSNVRELLDDSLSYGHSNGWIEKKNDLLNNLGSRLVYHSIKEDSIRVSLNNNIASVRFVGDFDVTLDGKRNQFHLRVLEVWVKREQDWVLFARQAIK